MKPEENRILAAIARSLATFRAERRALITILDEAQKAQRPPGDWRKDLNRLRETPEYRAILVEFESTFLQLEQTADLDEAIHLLDALPKDSPIN
jgi:hypothetical protein